MPPLPDGVAVVTEPVAGPLQALVQPDWAASPWLVQGTTTRRGARDFDLGLFSGGHGEATVRANWQELAEGTGVRSVVHARQVHGADLHVLGGPARSDAGREADGRTGSRTPAGPPDLLDPADGHLTDREGVLLAVTTADCVPVFLLDQERRAVAAVHAGWRGVAAGILGRAVAAMASFYGSVPGSLRVHLGPAICGSCYEVGPEVFEALGEEVPDRPAPIDVRAVLATRALDLGVPADRVTVSAHCTRCTGSDLYSHRGGDAQRQVGFIGVRGRAG